MRGSNNADFLVSITVSTAIASLGAPVGIGLPNLRFGEILTVIELTVAITVIVTALSGSTPLSDCAFRLLRWISGQPELPALGRTKGSSQRQISAPGG